MYAFSFVFANFGIAIAARMPMMTTTISSSISVKPLRFILTSPFPGGRRDSAGRIPGKPGRGSPIDEAHRGVTRPSDAGYRPVSRAMERGTPTSARRTPSGLLRIKLQCAVADWNTSQGWKWDRFVGWVGVGGTHPLVGWSPDFPSLAASERHARDRSHDRRPRALTSPLAPCTTPHTPSPRRFAPAPIDPQPRA